MINNLRHIRSFLAVARVGDFTRAASELHLSQSALTVQVRQLETDLGVTLFDRGKRRVVLTHVGKELRAPLERILIDAETVASTSREMSGLRRGLVAMAVLPNIAAHILPQALATFTKSHPGIVVQVHDIVSERIIEEVKKETVDFGLGCKLGADRELKTSPFFNDGLCAFVPSGHRLARRSSLLLKEIATSPLIVTGHDTSMRGIIEHALRRERLPSTFAYEVNYVRTAITFVRVGIGIAILAESTVKVEDMAGVRRIPIANARLGRKIEVIQRKDRSLSPAASEMLEMLRQVAARDV